MSAELITGTIFVDPGPGCPPCPKCGHSWPGWKLHTIYSVNFKFKAARLVLQCMECDHLKEARYSYTVGDEK